MDPDGRSDKKGSNLNYFPKCESIYEWSEKEIRPVNSFVIAAHGNPNGIYRYPNSCNTGKESLRLDRLEKTRKA